MNSVTKSVSDAATQQLKASSGGVSGIPHHRQRCMEMALQHLCGTSADAKGVVEAAKIFEAYLKGEPA